MSTTHQGVFLFYVVKFEKLKYLDYDYPWWGHFIGALLAGSSMLCVPVYMVYVISRQEGTLMEVNYNRIQPILESIPTPVNAIHQSLSALMTIHQ